MIQFELASKIVPRAKTKISHQQLFKIFVLEICLAHTAMESDMFSFLNLQSPKPYYLCCLLGVNSFLFLGDFFFFRFNRLALELGCTISWSSVANLWCLVSYTLEVSLDFNYFIILLILFLLEYETWEYIIIWICWAYL